MCKREVGDTPVTEGRKKESPGSPSDLLGGRQEERWEES